MGDDIELLWFQQGGSDEKKSTPHDDAFTSVGGHRRRVHERRSSWGGNRGSSHEGIGRRGSASQGDNYHRRHNNQESARRGNPHRRNKSDAEALLGRSGANSGKDVGMPASKQPQKPVHHSGSRQQKGTSSENPKSVAGSRNVWNHPDRRSHRVAHGKASGQKASHRGSQSVAVPVQPCTPAQIQMEEENSPKAEPVRDDQSSETSPRPAQTPVVSKKMAWIKGSIPASVIGKPKDGLSSGYATCKESDGKQSKTVESRSGSVATDVSINSPATPDATEANTPSIQSDSDKSQKACTKKPGSALAHIKTMSQQEVQSWHSRDSAAYSTSQAEGKVDPVRFDGNGEQFFQMVQSVSAVEEEVKEVSEAGSNADDADDESQPSGFESGQENSPTAPVMMGQPMPPPFGMPMGGPMGPMSGYHPGNVPWMRPVGGMGPSMRPMYPFMAPPPSFIHPPSVSGPSTSPPVTSGAPQVSSPAGGAAQSANDPIRPPGGPMYFYPPHVMPHGPPVMQPFMPMMPGHWVGYPMGPHPPPFMGPGRMTQKKFTLRPTAKEFIPPSMLNDGGSEVASDGDEDSMALLRVEADARDSVKAVAPAIQQEV